MNAITAINYPTGDSKSETIPLLAIVFSVALHAALLLGFPKVPFVPIIAGHTKPESMVPFTMVDQKDEPDPIDDTKPLDATPSVAVPVISDAPVVVHLNDFTQTIVPPALDTNIDHTLVTIPINVGPGTDGRPIEKVFNPDDLDRRPEPISRPSPSFPYELQREVAGGNVVVGFVVNSHGDVVQAHIISSSHHGFERAALTAIEKWKFRPGIKNGRKVNTRVEQPLSFLMQSDR